MEIMSNEHALRRRDGAPNDGDAGIASDIRVPR